MIEDCDVAIRPQEDPEIVALGGQTVEDVKDMLKKAGRAACEEKKKKEEEIADLFSDYKGKEPEYKYSYQDQLCDYGLFDLRTTENCGFREGVDVFAEWRRLADVNLGDKELQPRVVGLTEDLMDFILTKLNKNFPKLNIYWSKGTWNPRLTVNGCYSKICMENLGLAYQGLLNIIDEHNAQVLLADIVEKKFKELFI